MKGTVCIALACLLLTGCAGQKVLRPSAAGDLRSLLSGQTFALTVAPGAERLLQGAVSNDGTGIIERGNAAAQNIQVSVNSSNNAGGGAGVGLGVAIGTALAANLSQGELKRTRQDEARQRVAPLRAALDAQALDGVFAEGFTRAFAQANRPISSAGAFELRVEPQALLSQDSRSLRLVSEVQLMHGRQAIYQGRIEVQGRALECSTNCLDQWSASDAKAYREALDSTIVETVRVLLLDWDTEHFAGQLGAEKTLRYQVGEDRYVERGRLWNGALASAPVFLSLRGWIKSIPVPLQP
ncbi:hypothetical protein LNN38_02685 [Pseudomonas sp. LA21]|uniref:hypothetical protein n=1 Tax=unclassified Pseudomonas TaxID=196821 RepID=UPI001FB818F9|nr:hypothetical protein [Pseudomonas sp. LA21]MCJ1883745.1 hypothetical protein [Pseudomonas sp. LA21]